MNKHILACAIGLTAIAQAHASIVTATVPGGTMSVNVSDTYPQTTAGQVTARAGLPTYAGVSQASGDNGAIQLAFTNGYTLSAPTNAYGVYTANSTSFSPTLPRGPASLGIPLTFSSQAASTAGYKLDFYGVAGGNYSFSDGRYEIDYSFKVTATDASGNTQTVLDMIAPATGGSDTSHLASGLLATALIPQGFDLNSVQAQFDVTVKTIVPPSSSNHAGTASGDWTMGVTSLVLSPTSAIPEAGTATLMLIGLAGLAAVKRPRKQA